MERRGFLASLAVLVAAPRSIFKRKPEAAPSPSLTVLNESQRQRTERYLATRYGVTLPGGLFR